MTSIDTLEARKYWKKKGGEVEYLKAIQYVMLDQMDEESELYISIKGDEEGNYEHRLTKKSALWLADELKKLARQLK